MIELTRQQQEAMDAGPPPPRLLDPRTNKEYVLIEAESYGRLKDILEGEAGPSMEQVAQLVERAMEEVDRDDPTLNYYQETYGKKQ